MACRRRKSSAGRCETPSAWNGPDRVAACLPAVVRSRATPIAPARVRRALIVDTSALLAFFDSSELDHAAVARVIDAGAEPLVVSPYVVAELDYLIGSRLGCARRPWRSRSWLAAHGTSPRSAPTTSPGRTRSSSATPTSTSGSRTPPTSSWQRAMGHAPS
ncbi:MAG: PIN domain-containing protein [Chloroflexota bacterium]